MLSWTPPKSRNFSGPYFLGPVLLTKQGGPSVCHPGRFSAGCWSTFLTVLNSPSFLQERPKEKKSPMDTPILQTRRLLFREVKTVHRGAGLQGNTNVKKTDSIGSAQKETVELSQLGETEKFGEACSSLLNRLICQARAWVVCWLAGSVP